METTTKKTIEQSDRTETARQWRALAFDKELDGYPLLSPEGLAAIATDPEYQRRILTTINNFDALVAALGQARETINDLTWNRKITGTARERLSRMSGNISDVLRSVRA